MKNELFESSMQANILVLHSEELDFFFYVFCIDVQLLFKSVLSNLQYDWHQTLDVKIKLSRDDK